MKKWISKGKPEWHWSGIALMSPHGRSDEVKWLNDWSKKAKPTPAFVEWPDCIPHIKDAEKVFGTIRWARVLKLEAHHTIDWHIDKLPSWITRAHVPLNSVEGVRFEVRGHDKPIIMIPGRLTVLNATVEHRVINDGDEDRIHLVIDAGDP